jgi:hypothetical protein
MQSRDFAVIGLIMGILSLLVVIFSVMVFAQPETNQTTLLKQFLNESKTRTILQQDNAEVAMQKLNMIEIDLQHMISILEHVTGGNQTVR